MINKRIIAIITILSLMIITQTGCGSEAEPVSVDKYALDTTCNITVYGTGEYGSAKADDKSELDEKLAKKAIDKAYKLCSKLDKTLSKTVETSDISRINSAGGEWTKVSDYTIEIIRKGIEYSKISDGAFDITVGGVTAQWDFHASDPKLPDKDELREAVNHVNYACVEIEGNRVRLTDAKAQLDLGGIAKGYIGDKLAECLINNGVNSGIVNLGGNVICIGNKPDGSAFSIGVEVPYSDRTAIMGTIAAEDSTLVTSGVYERYFELDGKQYHHILSTLTGYPVESDTLAVTLKADIGKSADIDALSTICLIKGSETGLKLIESMDGIEACFTLRDGSRKTTKGMKIEE